MLEVQFKTTLVLVTILGVWLVFTFMHFAKSSPKYGDNSKHLTFKIIGGFLLLLAIIMGIGGLNLFSKVEYPWEIQSLPDSYCSDIKSLLGFPTPMQSLIISMIRSAFSFMALGVYFLCFKKSESSLLTKIFKIIFLLVLDFLYYDVTEDWGQISLMLYTTLTLCSWIRSSKKENKSDSDQNENNIEISE